MAMEPIPTGRITGSITLSKVRIVASVLSLAAGAGLVVAGLTTLLLQPNRAAADRISSDVLAGRTVDSIQLEATRDALRTAQDGSLVAQAGWMSIDLARNAGFGTEDGQVWLQRAVADLRRGLMSAPANGLGWLRLAGAEYMLNGPAPAGGAAMRMAAYLVRGSERSTGLVLSLGANYWTQLEPDQQGRLKKVMQETWQSARQRRLLKPLVTSEAGVEALRAAVGQDASLEPWIQEQQKALAQDAERRALRP